MNSKTANLAICDYGNFAKLLEPFDEDFSTEGVQADIFGAYSQTTRGIISAHKELDNCISVAPIETNQLKAVGADIEENTVNVVTDNFSVVADFVESNETIFVVGEADKEIYSRQGDNTVVSLGGYSNTIKGTADNDYLKVFDGQDEYLLGRAGDDVLTVAKGSNVVLTGEKGNDTYKLLSAITPDMLLTIDQAGANSNDKDCLQLVRTQKDDVSFVFAGDDLKIKHNNGGLVLVKAWSNSPLSKLSFNDGIMTADDIAALAIIEDVPVGGVTQLAVIQQLMQSLNNTKKTGFAAMNEAIAACSLGKYNSMEALVNSFIYDCTNYSGPNYSANQTGFLKEYCGIDLNNADTGAITGFDAGGTVVKTSESIVKEKDFDLSDYDYRTQDYLNLNLKDLDPYFTIAADATIYGKTVGDVTFYWSDDNIHNLIAYDYDETCLKQIISGVINLWAEPAMELIEESYKLSMNSSGSTWAKMSDGTVAIQLYLSGQPNNNTLASVNSKYEYNPLKPNITTYTTGALVINAAYFNNTFSEENGASQNGSAGFLDRVIAHEMVHGVMAANINMFGKCPAFVCEGLAELVHGIDDERKRTILDLCNTEYSGTWNFGDSESVTYDQNGILNAVFDLTNTGNRMGSHTYAGGYMLLRYLAKQVADYSASAGLDSYVANNLAVDYGYGMAEVNQAMLGFSDSGLANEAEALFADNHFVETSNNRFLVYSNI